MHQKVEEIFFDFEIIAFELVTLDTRFYWEEYLSSGVKMLTNILKISATTKTELFELIFFQSSQKIWQKYCPEDLSSLADALRCWLSINILTWGFLGI